MNRHIVYCLIDPRVNEVRYIGKSSRGLARPKMHQTGRGRRGDTHNHRWLRQMWADGETLPCILVMRECDTENEALAHEVRLIAMFREAGFELTNITDGGEGTSGAVCSAEARAKISAAQLGRKHSPETKAKMRAARLGKRFPPWPPEIRAKMSASQIGKKVSAETRAKMRAANLGKKRPPLSTEHKAKLRAAKLGKKLSAETRAKLRAANLGKGHSAETRAKMSAARLGKKRSAETIAKMSAAGLGHAVSAETRAKLSATHRRLFQERQKALLTAAQETCTVPAAQETRKESES